MNFDKNCIPPTLIIHSKNERKLENSAEINQIKFDFYTFCKNNDGKGPKKDNIVNKEWINYL